MSSRKSHLKAGRLLLQPVLLLSPAGPPGAALSNILLGQEKLFVWVSPSSITLLKQKGLCFINIL